MRISWNIHDKIQWTKEVANLKQINIGLLGLGTVGGGVAKIMHDHAQKMSDTEGIQYQVTKIFVRDIEKSKAKHPGLPESIQLTTDFNDVINRYFPSIQQYHNMLIFINLFYTPDDRNICAAGFLFVR